MYYFGTVYPPWWRMAQSSWNSFLSQLWQPGASLPKETFVTALFGKSHYFSSPVFFTSQILHSCSRRSKYSEPLPFRHRGWPNWWWPQHSPSGSGLSHPPVLLCFYPSSRTPKHKIEIGCITLYLNMFLRIFDYFFSVHQLGISFKDPFHRKQPSGSIPRSVVVAVDRKITSCNPPQKVPVEGMAWEISGKKKVVKMENTRAIIPRVIGLIL